MKTLLENDIFKPVTPEEAEARQLAYIDIRRKEVVEELKKQGTLNPDGTYDFGRNVDISKLELKSIEELGIKFGSVEGYFDCKHNKLTSLVGGPTSVGGNFSCYSNKLITLEGVPEEIGGNFYCSYNQLTTLEGAPKKLNKSFDCSHNLLTTLKGAPKEVRGYFDCDNNQLTSLVGAPKEVGGFFDCLNNKSKFTEEQVREVSNVKGQIVV